MRTNKIDSQTVELVKRAQAGDNYAFDALVCRFQDRAVAYAASVLGDCTLAQDVAQEAFIEVYRTLAALHTPEAFASWFRKIVFKYCDRMTRGKQFATVPIEHADRVVCSQITPESNAERKELQTQIHQAFQSLPITERQIVTLFYMGEHSYREIADFLELPLSTVKSRLHEGRCRLKGKMLAMVEHNLYESRPSKDEQFHERIMTFTRRFSGMIGGGQSIVRSLFDLAEQQTDGEMRDVLTQIRMSVQNGATLSEAMSECPDVFSDRYIDAIRQGEQSDLRLILRQLAQ